MKMSQNLIFTVWLEERDVVYKDKVTVRWFRKDTVERVVDEKATVQNALSFLVYQRALPATSYVGDRWEVINYTFAGDHHRKLSLHVSQDKGTTDYE